MSVLGKALRAYTLSGVLALSLAVPVFAEPGHSQVLSTIRIGNFGSVNDHYFRGAQPKGHDYADLAALGIKTVVDFQQDGDPTEPGMVAKAGMKYVRIPMTTRVVPTPDQLVQFLTLVNDPANQPVYVHCAGGRHRTGVMTAIYRMTGEGWKSGDAFSEMKKYNFGADYLHPEFKRFVFDFHPETITAALQAIAAKVTDVSKASVANVADAASAAQAAVATAN